MNETILISLLLALSSALYAQKGGENVYSFLDLTNSARAAALGGQVISVADDDINFVYHNPALLSGEMDQHFTLNYVNYFAGINYGYSSYAFHKEGIGNFAGGIHYVDYGIFERTDEYGYNQGYFKASEYAINLFYSRPILDSLLTIGVNVKPVFSVFEQYSSMGLLADVGLLYHHKESLTTAALVVRNAGFQVYTYAGSKEKMPFEIQAGITKGLEHAPFRFSILMQNLERWDLTYTVDEDDDFFFGNSGAEEEILLADFADKFMRHMVLGVEFLLGENFHFDFGYNYKRRQEMKINDFPGTVGFSWGVGFKVKKFHVAYGRATYHLAGGTNQFSIMTNLSEFYKK